MIISIDFDETFSADRFLWEQFIALAHARGHQCIIVTSRYDHGEERKTLEEYLGMITLPVLYTNKLPIKHKVALEAGYNVNIWIEDKPWLIGKEPSV